MRLTRKFRSSKSRAIKVFGSRSETEKGQALIETALAMPLLLLLLVGALEFGLASYESIEVSNAALAAVTYGALNSSNAGNTAAIQAVAANDAQNITLGTTAVSHSCICSNGSASTCLPTDCSTSNIETILTVRTQATFNPGFHIPFISPTFTLHGQAVQKVLQ